METELDPRLRFYLEHKNLIDEWLELPKLEHETADRFFKEAEGHLRDGMPGWTGDPELFSNVEDYYRRLLLHRPDWGEDSDDPIIGVGLEWTSKSGFSGAYVGVRLLKSDPRIEDLRPLMDVALADLDWKSTPWWPKWKYVEPENDKFWLDLATFRAQLMAEIKALWERTHHQLGQVFNEIAG